MPNLVSVLAIQVDIKLYDFQENVATEKAAHL